MIVLRLGLAIALCLVYIALVLYRLIIFIDELIDGDIFFVLLEILTVAIVGVGGFLVGMNIFRWLMPEFF